MQLLLVSNAAVQCIRVDMSMPVCTYLAGMVVVVSEEVSGILGVTHTAMALRIHWMERMIRGVKGITGLVSKEEGLKWH